ncbi:hypothetical protein C2845_PM01G33220 [Panicum miliaceum]|uniref:Uncharacterized protein n=1 Tax=Panicum miliaceum TaxID=4540 RepID=A0A3L6TQV6_PANMI|nr:hypothetical protein C2845_PM01G33220 [Panicum miliaceum]
MNDIGELSDERKEPLHTPRQVYTPKSKFGILLLLLLLSFVPSVTSKVIDEHYCNMLGSQIQGYCPAFLPSPYCCPLILTVMDQRNDSSCLCHVLNSHAIRSFGLSFDDIIDLYYNCHGKKQKDSFSELCNQNVSTNAPSPVERPSSHGDMSGVDRRVKTVNHYTAGMDHPFSITDASSIPQKVHDDQKHQPELMRNIGKETPQPLIPHRAVQLANSPCVSGASANVAASTHEVDSPALWTRSAPAVAVDGSNTDSGAHLIQEPSADGVADPVDDRRSAMPNSTPKKPRGHKLRKNFDVSPLRRSNRLNPDLHLRRSQRLNPDLGE